MARWLLLALALATCRPAGPAGDPRPGWIDEARLQAADREPGNWFSVGRDAFEQHFSPLEQVNAANVATLGMAWQFEAPSPRGRVQHGFQATAVVVDGRMYVSGPWSVVYALDAATGKELWRYDPGVDGAFARRSCCGVSSRGVQVWKGKVYAASLDGYLAALDAGTGSLLWRVDTFIDRGRDYTITSAPHIAGSQIVVGNSGADFGVRGYVSAYDAETGAFAWRFFTVPGDPAKGFEHPEMELAAKSWDANSAWGAGLGGTVWGAMTYDPSLDLLYIGTGNSSPYPIWLRSPSGGDNLFLASIVAIRPSTGRMAWFYQTTPGEIWDYTATANLVLADLTIGGRLRRVLMTAPKNGFFYVLDRETGKLISAEKYVAVNWASHVDTATGRPVLTGDAWYRDGPKLVLPSSFGGHNWMPMSFSPKAGLVYIPTIERGMILGTLPKLDFKVHHIYQGVRELSGSTEVDRKRLTNGRPELLEIKEFLTAWDPVAQKPRWKVPLNGEFNGGVLSTAGDLAIQGRSNGQLVVYRATDGTVLKTIEVGTGIMAAPMTYAVQGEQYVAIMAGYGGGVAGLLHPESAPHRYQNMPRVIAFKLGGGPVPVPPKTVIGSVPAPPPVEVSRAAETRGAPLYAQHCGYCHGGGFGNLSAYPDLTRLDRATHQQFLDIVLGGKLAGAGMAGFADLLTEDEAKAIHAYLLAEQRRAYEAER